MDTKLEAANNEVNEVYFDLSDAVKSVSNDLVAPLDAIVKELSRGINLFSNPELWDFQVRLGIEAYRLGNIREQSELKEACAEALYKEAMAKSYTTVIGTQETKKQQSIIDTTDKQAVSMLYASVASLLKTKCDEAHRLINILQGIQISRAAEAKQSANPRSEQDALALTNSL